MILANHFLSPKLPCGEICLELFLLIDLNSYPDRFNVIDALLLSLHFYSAAADSRTIDPGHEEKLKVQTYAILASYTLKNQTFHAQRYVRSHVSMSTREIPSTNEKSPLPTSLSNVQSHMPYRNFVVATATLVTATF